MDMTCEELTNFVESINVYVVFCYEARTRIEDTKAFRVCIDKSDRSLFLNRNNWPRNITVRAWSFKVKTIVGPTAPENADTEMFTDASSSVEGVVQNLLSSIRSSSTSGTVTTPNQTH